MSRKAKPFCQRLCQGQHPERSARRVSYKDMAALSTLSEQAAVCDLHAAQLHMQANSSKTCPVHSVTETPNMNEEHCSRLGHSLRQGDHQGYSVAISTGFDQVQRHYDNPT